MAIECLALLRKVGRLTKERIAAGDGGDGGDKEKVNSMKSELEKLQKVLESSLLLIFPFWCADGKQQLLDKEFQLAEFEKTIAEEKRKYFELQGELQEQLKQQEALNMKER